MSFGRGSNEVAQNREVLQEIAERVIVFTVTIPDLRIDLLFHHVGRVETSNEFVIRKGGKRICEGSRLGRGEDPWRSKAPLDLVIGESMSTHQRAERRRFLPSGLGQEVVDAVPGFVEFTDFALTGGQVEFSARPVVGKVWRDRSRGKPWVAPHTPEVVFAQCHHDQHHAHRRLAPSRTLFPRIRS
jgi:hypothetical protein